MTFEELLDEYIQENNLTSKESNELKHAANILFKPNTENKL